MTPLSPPGPITGTDQELVMPAARSAWPARAALARTSGSATGRSVAAAIPTGPPAGPNGSADHPAICPGENPSEAAQISVWSLTRWMHSRSVSSAAPSADRISDRLEEGSADDQPVGEPVQPAELAARRGVHLLSGQQRDHVVGVGAARVEVAHDPPLPHYHDPVGQPEHLLDVVTGKQDRRALLAQAHDQRFDLGRFPDARGTRLARPAPAAAAGSASRGRRRQAGAGRRIGSRCCGWCPAAGSAGSPAPVPRPRGTGSPRA